MAIKISNLLLIFIIQFVSAIDSNNCTEYPDELLAQMAENPQMKFYLFTNKNFYNEQQILLWNKTTLTNSNFNNSNPTRILVHGWKNNLKSCFNGFIKDAYLKKGDFNVFVVDWSDWAKHIDYYYVANLIFGEIGDILAQFTIFLNLKGVVAFDNMYLIGHSLGAHMCGAAGQFIKKLGQYNTIFGLDPAGPNFFTESEDKRLDSSDAKYVEEISTGMGILGYLGVLGHAAFYPNYGKSQPYCNVLDIICSHLVVNRYFAESINSPIGFCSQECPYDSERFVLQTCSKQCPIDKTKLMGGEPSVPKNGTYYVAVNAKSPFARCSC